MTCGAEQLFPGLHARKSPCTAGLLLSFSKDEGSTGAQATLSLRLHSPIAARPGFIFVAPFCRLLSRANPPYPEDNGQPPTSHL